jgi:hypothetical protein
MIQQLRIYEIFERDKAAFPRAVSPSRDADHETVRIRHEGGRLARIPVG